ncbi:odorant receptor 46a-like [Polyergus mexicanus]|uniref:odorant receptor 46a-like n=1 Tax=Polyergus mexicanus TaxID=615972 RepID=UPI0038B5CFCE
MYTIEKRYYKINRVLLKILGLWPYQQSYFSLIHKVLFASLLLTFILVQLLVFVTTQYDTNLLLKILSTVFPIVFVTIKYCSLIIQADSVKKMLEQIQDDWRLLKNKLEVDFIKKYAYNIQFSSIILILIGLLCMFLLIIPQCLPLILDIILPLNESRHCQLFVITEYFINQEKYIYIILLHMVLACSIGLITLYGSSITFMTFLCHACALLKIASYRIENAIEKSALAIPIFERQNLFCQRIINAILIHRRAIEYINLLISNFATLFAILIIVGVISLSLCLFQFLQLITLTDNITDILIFAFLICIHLAYMFVANYAGQILTDNGLNLFQAIYNGMWYAAPLHTQKMLLFMMQKGTVNIKLGYDSIFAASLEGFTMLVNAAVSYFLMIYSTRQ